MASLLSPRRTTAGLSLQASDAGPKPPEMAVETGDGPPVGWPVAAIAGGLVSALVGWVLCAGLAVVGWLAADPGTLANALGVGTQFWLLANGVSVSLEGLVVTLVPWGATAVAAYMMAWSAGFAARRIRSDQLAGPFTVAGVLLATYLVPVLGIGAWQGQPWRDPLHWAAVILVLGLAAVWGACRALGRRFTDGWPDWARALPRAVLGAQLVLLAFAAALLVTSLIRHLDRVTALHAALDPGVAGGIALLAAQLAVVPNVLVWTAAYALGAGFAVGTGSVVAPAATELGILPGLPLLGALPGAGPGSPLLLLWLVSGAVAGALAAVLVVRSRPGLRFDTSSLVGGLAAVLAALVFVALGWAAGGDLGVTRLTGLGPRLLPLLVMAVTTMGLAGLLTGLVLGLLRLRRRSGETVPDEHEASAQPH
ncbi:MAG TPA: DUF6350 family protein [Propionibacteriaceae bacterium]|jgi:hypothetical protein|nr:DUF6350 family protein [Propionibacteriaceae bacterium]